MRKALVLGAFALSLVGARADAAPRATGTVRVAFVQGEQLVRIARAGSTPRDALNDLIAGPTAAERSHGFRTYLAPSTRVLNFGVAGPVATVDLNRAFSSGSIERIAARLSQLVRTLTGLDGITRVQILVDGK